MKSLALLPKYSCLKGEALSHDLWQEIQFPMGHCTVKWSRVRSNDKGDVGQVV